MTKPAVDGRLAELGLVLPEIAPTHQFAPVNVLGNMAYVSGHAPYRDGEFRYRGKVGREFDLQAGREAAELSVLGCLASLDREFGGLDCVGRVLKLNGYVNADPEFTEAPTVTDAASELLVHLFGEAGRHSRTTVGVASLPEGVAVEIEVIVALGGGSRSLCPPERR